MKKNIFLFLVILFLSGCHSKTRQETFSSLVGKKIVLNEQNFKKKWNYSELFDSIRIIPLETNTHCLIGEITRLKYTGQMIFVLDGKSESLFAFDNEGRFLWKIHSVGRGPREYNRVMDIDIDTGQQLINLYANYPQKLMQYDFKGKFIREYSINLNANSVATQKDWLILNSANQANLIDQKLADPHLLIKNLKTDSLYTYLPATLKDNTHSCLIFNYGEGFFRYQQELLLFTPMDRRIYSVSGKDFRIKYEFDFGNYNLPPNLSMKEIRESDYCYGLNSFWENTRYCYFEATMKFFPLNFIYDKQRDVLYYGILSDDLGHYSPKIVSATDRYMIGFAPVSELIMTASYWENEKGIADRPVSRLVRQLEENDNPVVFLYQFK